MRFFWTARAKKVSPTTKQSTVATTEASAPNAQPETHSGPVSVPFKSPSPGCPDTVMPKIPPCVKFHAV